MITSPDFSYSTSRAAAPWPAMVREPAATRNDDELFQLGERIADLAARINAAESQMMTLIADFDRRGGWKDGFSSCAEWLAWRIGIKIGAARERVRTARALENLPQTADALREGSISYAKVRALTRVATPGREAELLEFARAGSAAKLEQTVRMLRKLSREGELTAEEARHRSRTFSVFVDGDGMYVVKGRLEPEAGAVLMRAVEAASDALFRRERGAGDAHDASDARPAPKQRRADAVGLLAERALSAGFGGGECREAVGGVRDSGDHARRGSGAIPGDDAGQLGCASQPGISAGQPGINARQPIGDADEPGGDLDEWSCGSGDSISGPRDVAQAPSRVESGTRAERYQVMVHCDAATLAVEGEPGRSDLDGIRVSSETSRRMACDAAVVAMVHAKDGSLLSVGRRTRTIPPHIRRALEERDRGCRFPGCGGRFTEAHHVKHWADGGETSLRNTLLLCRRHHRAVHEGRVKVSVNRDGRNRNRVQRGRALPRLSYPLGDRSSCPGSHGGFSGTLKSRIGVEEDQIATGGGGGDGGGGVIIAAAALPSQTGVLRCRSNRMPGRRPMHNLRRMSSTSLIRTFLFSASAFVATIVLPAAARAQTPPDVPAPSDTIYEVRLGDGSVIFARVAELDEERVVFVTVGGARLEIERSGIRDLRPAAGQVVDGEFWTEDPGGTRLFFTSTGRSLGRGESYVGTYVIVLPFAAVGVTDRFTIVGGAPVLFGELEPFYIGPKIQILRRPEAQVALGTLAFFFDDEVVGVAYGVGTFGNTDDALSAGIGFFYSGDEVVNEPAFMVGGETRVSRRIKLITENYVLPDAVGVILSGGVRIIGDRFNTEVGILGAVSGDETGCCVPLINFSYSFGR